MSGQLAETLYEGRNRGGKLFSFLPFLWILGLAGLVVRTRIYLGYWPKPAHPDPKSLPFELHHMALWLGFFLLIGIFVIAIGRFVLSSLSFKRKVKRKSLWSFMVCFSLILVMFFSPSSAFNWVAWFFD